MKTEVYDYDEGYGYGVQQVEKTGMTVNEIIIELNKLSDQGYGDRIVFDVNWYPIEQVEIVNHSEYEVKVPYII